MRQWKWIKLKLVVVVRPGSQLRTESWVSPVITTLSDYLRATCLSLSMSAATWSNLYWNLPSDPGLKPVLSPRHMREVSEPTGHQFIIWPGLVFRWQNTPVMRRTGEVTTVLTSLQMISTLTFRATQIRAVSSGKKCPQTDRQWCWAIGPRYL